MLTTNNPIPKRERVQLKNTVSEQEIIQIHNDPLWPELDFISIAQAQKKTMKIRKHRSYLDELLSLEQKF